MRPTITNYESDKIRPGVGGREPRMLPVPNSVSENINYTSAGDYLHSRHL